MKAYALDPATQKIEEIDIAMQANTTYTFFKSILIDELATLNQHSIQTDANALSEKKKGFFIGEQLVIGVALVSGRNGLQECDASIPEPELHGLVNFNLNEFYTEVLDILSATEINLYTPFSVKQGEDEISLSTEWTIFTFNLADERTREYFITELKKTIEAKEDVLAFMQKMAQLAIRSAR